MKLNILFLTLDDIAVLEFIAYSIQESLEDTSINILQAECDKDAIRILETTKINLIITDMNINTIEPYDFHDNLQLTPEYKEIPFVFLSSDPEDRMIVILKENSDFFLKPLNINQLMDTLSSILKNEKSSYINKYYKLHGKSQLETIYQDTDKIEKLIQNNNNDHENKDVIIKLTSNIKEQLKRLSTEI